MERSNIRAILGQAMADAAQHPGLLVALYLLNLAAGAAAGFAFARILGPELAGRPAPDLFQWAVLTRTTPGLVVELILTGFVVAAVYLLGGAAAAGGALERLGGGSALAGVRHLPRLLGLRVLLGVPVLGLSTLWVVCGRWLWPISLGLADDRGPLLVQAAVALAMVGPILWLLLVHHYAQALIVGGQGLLRALAAAARLCRRAPLRCLGVWVCCWSSWVGVTLLFGFAPVEHPVAAQIAVALRVVVHIWSLAAARRVAGLSPSASRPRSAPGPQTSGSAAGPRPG